MPCDSEGFDLLSFIAQPAESATSWLDVQQDAQRFAPAVDAAML
jgi:hypothetical protein